MMQLSYIYYPPCVSGFDIPPKDIMSRKLNRDLMDYSVFIVFAAEAMFDKGDDSALIYVDS